MSGGRTLSSIKFLVRSYPQPFSRGPCGARREMVVGNSVMPLLHLFELPLLVIISQLSRAVEDSQRTIEIPMDLHPGPDVVAAIMIRGDLECHPLKGDAVVGADRPLILFTEDVIEIVSLPGDKR